MRQTTLELALEPDDAARLVRVPALARLRLGRPRIAPLHLVWHDTPTADLAADGLSLCERRAGKETLWRLERMRGGTDAPYPPGAPPPLIAQAARHEDLGHAVPQPLMPVAACEGTTRSLPLADAAGALQMSVLSGTLRAVAGERPFCRLLLAGPSQAVEAMALALSDHVRLSVPAASLAAEAFATAGRHVPPQAIGAPSLPTRASVGEAFAQIAGHLAGVVLHWAPLASAQGGPEPVHQMRVAVRRLRSAISLFRRATGGPPLDTVQADLRALMQVLGPARDWDVFTAGTGRAVAEAFTDDRAVGRLISAAERRRQECYAALDAYLHDAAFRALGIRLACLVAARPWEDRLAVADDDAAGLQAAERQAELLATPLEDFARHALSRRLAHAAEVGDDLSALPDDQVHRVRIQVKRLRYAVEFFAPLYPRNETRRFARRVAAVQERLGHLNDGAVAQQLMAQLSGGADRGYAIGVVRGFVAAGHTGTRGKAQRSWQKFFRLEPFWT